MTSIIKPGSHTRISELLGLLPTPLSLPPSIPNHGYDLSPRISRHRTSLKICSPMDVYMSFHVVMFSFLLSPSFTRTTLIFRITTLTIPFDSADYVIHAACIHILFFLCTRRDDILNLYMLVILQFVKHFVFIRAPIVIAGLP